MDINVFNHCVIVKLILKKMYKINYKNGNVMNKSIKSYFHNNLANL